jgi:hypothetical protein
VASQPADHSHPAPKGGLAASAGERHQLGKRELGKRALLHLRSRICFPDADLP